MNGTFKDLSPNTTFIFLPEIPEVYLGIRCDLYLKLDPTKQGFDATKGNSMKESSQELCHIPDDEKVIEIV